MYALDALRGIAALGIVVFHWPMILVDLTVQKANLPFYKFLSVFYEKGWLAVDIFFMLSGFIFSWLYAEAIAKKQIGAYKYVIMRFSRLYPLHLLTLLIVLVGQYIFFLNNKKYFSYDHNDAYHFLLNIGFVSSWSFEKGLSFNAPIWSVSVEVFLYGVFFLSCLYIVNFRRRLIYWCMFSIIGYFIITKYYAPIGRGVGSFFFGACIFPLYCWVRNHKSSNKMSRFIVVVTLIFWSFAIYFLNCQLNIVDETINKLTQHFPVKILFPLTILTLALVESDVKGIAKRFAFLGDISYAMYLLHFPLQLLFLIAVRQSGDGGNLFISELVFSVYFVLLIGISLMSYHFLERPAQKIIRNAAI